VPAVGQASLLASHGPSITAISEPYELPRAQRLRWEEATRVAEPVAQTIRPRKMNDEIHSNTIPHLHMRLVPRLDGDPFAKVDRSMLHT
jgi:diadenosine tetraphosphate (Ap4A) HIT family hydrolase